MIMGKVLDTNPPPTRPAPATEPDDPRRVVVYLVDDADRAAIIAHADDLAMPLSALLRRCTATAVRATTRAGCTVRQLVDGAAAALGRDFPMSFGADHPKRGQRAAESVMRWLLARYVVLPLPAPSSGNADTGPVWTVRLEDASSLTVRRAAGKVVVGDRSFTEREWLAVAAAGTAAAVSGGGDTKQRPTGNDQPS